ncbi:MAG: hypothetical protein WBP72_12105, partial [Rhodocyclaceae bacterium]
MESLVLGAIALVFAIGFIGGLVGSRMRRGGQPEGDPDWRHELEQLAARARSLHVEHQSIRARVAALEAQAKAGVILAPPPPAAAPP